MNYYITKLSIDRRETENMSYIAF